MQKSKLQLKIQKLKNYYHLLQAVLANLYYGFPSRRLKVIGVTGTDGKTTTTHLIYHILKTGNKKVSLVSSVFAKIGDREYDTGFHVTTPNPFDVQKLLKAAADHGDEYFVLETTSHALDQYRVWGIKYEIGVITNITYEHLDYHQTYEEYVKAKAKLLSASKLGVINEDDRSYSLLKKAQSSPLRQGFAGQAKFKVQSYNSKFKVLKDLPGITKFNEYNYSAAYSVCNCLGINDEIILKAMQTFKLPKGRLETVYDKEFKVIVDFAHTPNAIKNILQSIKGNIIHVFGSAGQRDNLKRPLMGEESAKYSQTIILTEEDYRTEDPNKICQQIASGIKNKKYSVIINRQKAIEKAISLAKKSDTVVITGKGHEKSLCRGKTEYPWDDRAAVLEALEKYDYL